jgi:hypothetical protein
LQFLLGAVAAARERQQAASQATAVAEARLRAEKAAKAAGGALYRARWQAFWAGARFRPIAVFAGVAFVGGIALGVSLGGAPAFKSRGSVGAAEPRLKLDDDVEAFGRRVANAIPRDRRDRPRR